MTQVIEILPRVRQEPSYIANTMGANVLATQGARELTTMILAMLNRDNSG